MPFVKKRNKRTNFLICVLIVAMTVGVFRVGKYQLSNAGTYKNQAAGLSARTAVIKAPRGEILDCYGRKIAVNRDGYNIVFNRGYIDFDTVNGMILSLCKFMQGAGGEWVDNLPLEKTAPYGFTKSENEAFLKRIGLAHYASAKNAFDKLVSTYKLEQYSMDEARIIMGVRYSMDQAEFSVANPYTYSEDVSDEIMLGVSENSFLLSGVTVETVPFREYVSGDVAPNLIGTVGPIYAEEWYGDESKGIVGLKDKGYNFSDKVGKSGIESYYEDILHGTDGEMTYYLNSNGDVISSEITVEPIPGKTVMLTLDKNVQQKTQAALSNTIAELNAQGGNCTGGAAVVMNVKEGKVIASANHPTYDINTYLKDYNSILNAPNKPLLNRAFQGIYPVGSTIKPVVAIAGIDNGHLNVGEGIRCIHTYDLFADYKPSCMGTHGLINLNTALAKSCNYYFFEVGRRVGATKLTDYYRQFGLGVATGVEVDDSKGLLANVAEGSGDTLQIAIGQKNAFTPLQVAVYTSALANGGTRYKATLLERIVSYDLKDVYTQNSGEVLNTIKISEDALNGVKAGMLSVTEDGTGSRVFADYPIKVGGKTGTSQVTGGIDNSVFVAFAPFDNPEIAIAVVLEHGNNGFAAGSVVKAALDSYFFADQSTVDNTPDYTLLF